VADGTPGKGVRKAGSPMHAEAKLACSSELAAALREPGLSQACQRPDPSPRGVPLDSKGFRPPPKPGTPYGSSITRLQVGVAASDMDPIPREAIDAPTFRYFEDVALDVAGLCRRCERSSRDPLAETLSVR